MKINKITSTNLNLYNIPEKDKRAERPVNPPFKGFDSVVGSVVVPVSDFVERGGIAVSFTVQDMFGTNFPRTIKGLYRNKDITGEYNFQEATEVALREFITGPSMFIIPITMLALVKNFLGRAFNVPMKRTEAFSNILNENRALVNSENLNNPVLFKEGYYTKVFENILKSSTTTLSDDGISEKAQDFAKRLVAIEQAKKNGFFATLRNKINPASKEGLSAEFTSMFHNLVKGSRGDKTRDFYSAVITKNGEVVTSTKISNLMASLSDYTDDLIKSCKKHLGSSNFDEKSIGDFISKFMKNRIGGRFILNLLLCASVVTFCTTIPKIYMRNKKFPGLKGLDENSQNHAVQTQQNTTEVKNANK